MFHTKDFTKTTQQESKAKIFHVANMIDHILWQSFCLDHPFLVSFCCQINITKRNKAGDHRTYLGAPGCKEQKTFFLLQIFRHFFLDLFRSSFFFLFFSQIFVCEKMEAKSDKQIIRPIGALKHDCRPSFVYDAKTQSSEQKINCSCWFEFGSKKRQRQPQRSKCKLVVFSYSSSSTWFW